MFKSKIHWGKNCPFFGFGPWALSKLLENHKIADIGSTEFKLFIKESPP